MWTRLSLKKARYNVQAFRELEGRYPNFLAEIEQYAVKNPDVKFGQCSGEHLSDADGNAEEFDLLSGKGGLFYNASTGEVKVNLTRPLKHYSEFYFGRDRNEVPSDW